MPTLSIEIPTEAVTRIQDAFTYALNHSGLPLVDENGEPRTADVNDVKAYVIADLKSFVRNAEKALDAEEFAPGNPIDFT